MLRQLQAKVRKRIRYHGKSLTRQVEGVRSLEEHEVSRLVVMFNEAEVVGEVVITIIITLEMIHGNLTEVRIRHVVSLNRSNQLIRIDIDEKIEKFKTMSVTGEVRFRTTVILIVTAMGSLTRRSSG